RLDGVVLSGGLDADPRRWGLPTHPAVQPVAERREDNDRALLRLVLRRQLPVLGIGLGMQQLNLACGRTLYLHLPEELPRALPVRRRRGAARPPPPRPPPRGPTPPAALGDPGPRLDEIYGGGEIRVNSSHHQAVRQPGKGLRVGARAPDGVIESIEADDANWF